MTTFKIGSIFRRHLFRIRTPIEGNITKDCVKAIPSSWGKDYKGETGGPIKVRLQEYCKAVTQVEIEMLGISDDIWMVKVDHRNLWDEVEVLDRETSAKYETVSNQHIC